MSKIPHENALVAPTAIEKFTGEPTKLDTSSAWFEAAHPTMRSGSAQVGAERQQAITGDRHLPGNFSIGGSERAPMTPGDHAYTTVIAGNTRHFEIHVPPNYDGKKPIPVMMVLPGMGGSIEQMKHETGMNRAADQKGFAVVYVEALPKPFPGTFGHTANGWNLDHGALTDKNASYNDLDYIKHVTNSVSRDLKVDPAARYIVGFSEGGGASQYVAESMPGTFAGVGSVHGTRLESDPLPKVGDKTAFVSILGDDDNMLPISGGHGFGEGGHLIKGFATITLGKVSQSEPLAQKGAWARADGLSIPYVHDDGKDRTTEYVGNGTKVTEIIRHGGMHAWDGLGQNPQNQITKKPDFGWPIIGVPNANEDTTRDVINALMPYRKDGKVVDMRRNLLNQ